MAPLIALASLAQVIPGVLDLFGAHKAADAVSKANDILGMARTVTGKSTDEEALDAVKADPNLAFQLQTKIIEQKTELARIEADREKAQAVADNEATRALTDRIALLEGTASDLKAIPFLGTLMLFLRGAQRIIIGYGIIYCDYMWFSAAWTGMKPVQENALFFVNLIVLVFLFGERAVRNVLPLVADFLNARTPGK